MSGSKNDRVFLGKWTRRDGATGVYSSVTAPGLGKASSMDRAVFEKAVKSANTVLRATKLRDANGRG